MTKSLSKAIALATLVGATASAHAVSVNPQGLGEVLLYSLYTAEEGNITNINITNTTNVAKAVKVRFLEGQNSQEVLDFNLYLSPRDQWSGAVTATADGAMLITADKSCTAPAIGAAGVAFKSLEYVDKGGDGGEQSLARTRVGHLEVIEMGTLTGDLAKAVEAGNGPGQAPANCGAIAKAFAVGGVWQEGTDLQAGLAAATMLTGEPGGLYGSASILNIDGSTQISYDAVAIKDFLKKTALGVDNLHARPGTIYPTLNGVVKAGGLSKTQVVGTSTVKDISNVLAVKRIHNDFVLDEARGSETNWVVTYPTKRFHVDTNMPDSLAAIAAAPLSGLNAGLAAAKSAKVGDVIVANGVTYNLVSGTTGTYGTAGPIDPATLIAGLEGAITAAQTLVNTALRPFQSLWTKESGKSCDSVALNVWDNEEFPLSNLEFSPSRPGEASKLCYETNILTFNGSKMLGGEFVSKNIELAQPDFQFGWMDIGFADGNVSGQPAGLPAIGFSAVTVKNNFTGNGLANNYGSATNHKATKAVTP